MKRTRIHLLLLLGVTMSISAVTNKTITIQCPQNCNQNNAVSIDLVYVSSSVNQQLAILGNYSARDWFNAKSSILAQYSQYLFVESIETVPNLSFNHPIKGKKHFSYNADYERFDVGAIYVYVNMINTNTTTTFNITNREHVTLTINDFDIGMY